MEMAANPPLDRAEVGAQASVVRPTAVRDAPLASAVHSMGESTSVGPRLVRSTRSQWSQLTSIPRWCGSTANYCGAGCQASSGTCAANDNGDGTLCGPDNGYARCRDGKCCSASVGATTMTRRLQTNMSSRVAVVRPATSVPIRVASPILGLAIPARRLRARRL